jgi:hypothetical protein
MKWRVDPTRQPLFQPVIGKALGAPHRPDKTLLQTDLFR